MVPLISVLFAMQAAQAAPVIPLWPNGAPGSEARKDEAETAPHPWSIANIQNPSLTVFRPEAGTANGTAVVICPGGGFRELVVGEEGFKAAAYFNKLGVTAFVLKYRLFREAGSTLTFEKDTNADAFRAMRLVRSNAAQWGIDPERIGMMGFSAGGEVLSTAVFATPAVAKPDAIDSADGRPNFAIWIYPGPLGVPAEVPKDAPPAFFLVAQDDGAANVVMDLASKYRKAGALAEVHILNGGGHGFNMGDRSNLLAVKTWPQRLADWLADRGLLKKG
ncbi:MAG: alpha/beta hydrolase [Fimbriimonas sp.]